MTPFWIGFTWMLIWVAISGSTLLVPKRWAPLCVLLATVWMFMGVLKAEDAKPTVEQLQAQIAAKNAQIAKLQQKLTIYQQSAFRCQDAMLDAQIDAQPKQPAPRPVKQPEPAKP